MTDQALTIAADGVDQAKYRREVSTGAVMPAVGLGTFGSDRYPQKKSEMLDGTVGYRHIDCAAVYGNQHEIGVKAPPKAPSSRILITSKLWNDKHAEEDVILANKPWRSYSWITLICT